MFGEMRGAVWTLCVLLGVLTGALPASAQVQLASVGQAAATATATTPAAATATTPATIELPQGHVSPVEPPPEGAALSLAEAKVAQAQAAELFRQNHFVQAAELLRLAYLGEPHPLLLFNAGQAYRKAERPLEAKYMYEQFVAAAPEHALTPEARGYIKDMEALAVTQQRGQQIALALEETKQREKEAALALEKERQIALETQRALVQTREQLERERNKPLYRRPWFWGVLSAVTVVVVAGTATGIVLGQRFSTSGGTITLGN